MGPRPRGAGERGEETAGWGGGGAALRLGRGSGGEGDGDWPGGNRPEAVNERAVKVLARVQNKLTGASESPPPAGMVGEKSGLWRVGAGPRSERARRPR